jgi:hypothetical protein
MPRFISFEDRPANLHCGRHDQIAGVQIVGEAAGNAEAEQSLGAVIQQAVSQAPRPLRLAAAADNIASGNQMSFGLHADDDADHGA